MNLYLEAGELQRKLTFTFSFHCFIFCGDKSGYLCLLHRAENTVGLQKSL